MAAYGIPLNFEFSPVCQSSEEGPKESNRAPRHQASINATILSTLFVFMRTLKAQLQFCWILTSSKMHDSVIFCHHIHDLNVMSVASMFFFFIYVATFNWESEIQLYVEAGTVILHKVLLICQMTTHTASCLFPHKPYRYLQTLLMQGAVQG